MITETAEEDDRDSDIDTTMNKKNIYKDPENRDPLTEKIIAAAYRVHNTLGPGFLERVYESALVEALNELRVGFEREKEFRVSYNGKTVGKFKVDLLVEDTVIIELKSISGRIPKIFQDQVISYLKAADLSVGLIINFGNTRCDVRRLIVHQTGKAVSPQSAVHPV